MASYRAGQCPPRTHPGSLGPHRDCRPPLDPGRSARRRAGRPRLRRRVRRSGVGSGVLRGVPPGTRDLVAPHVYWRRRPFHGTYINIDEQGRRRTWRPSPPSPRQEPVTKVFVFGGSVGGGKAPATSTRSLPTSPRRSSPRVWMPSTSRTSARRATSRCRRSFCSRRSCAAATSRPGDLPRRRQRSLRRAPARCGRCHAERIEAGTRVQHRRRWPHLS